MQLTPKGNVVIPVFMQHPEVEFIVDSVHFTRQYMSCADRRLESFQMPNLIQAKFLVKILAQLT